MKTKFWYLNFLLLLTFLWGCSKDKFGDTVKGAWKVEKVEWNYSTSSISRSGTNEHNNYYIVFKENSKGQWMFDNNNSSPFSYTQDDDLIYLKEFKGENVYSIVALTETSLILELVKEQVDWDNDGVLENVHDFYHCKRAY